MVKISRKNWFWALIFYLISCTNGGLSRQDNSPWYTMSEKIFYTGDTLNLNDISNIITYNDSGLCFYNPRTRYLYKVFETQNKSVKSALEYLDTIDNFVEIVYNNNDTLIVLNEYSIDLYLSKKLLKKIEINTDSNYSLVSIYPYFKPYYNPTSNKIFIHRYAHNAYQNKFNLCNYSIECAIDLTKLSIDTLHISYPKIYCDYDFGMLNHVDRTINGNYHYYSFSMYDKVVKYDIINRAIESIEIKLPYRGNLNYDSIGSPYPHQVPENKIYNMFFQSPSYHNIVYDKYRNYLYRFFMPENNTFKMGDRFLYLIVFDLNTMKNIGEIKFSRKDYFTDIIVLKNEILIPKNNFIFDENKGRTDKLFYTAVHFN